MVFSRNNIYSRCGISQICRSRGYMSVHGYTLNTPLERRPQIFIDVLWDTSARRVGMWCQYYLSDRDEKKPGAKRVGTRCQSYLSDRDEKKPGVLSFEAMKRVRPGRIHFAILFLINSGRVSRSR